MNDGAALDGSRLRWLDARMAQDGWQELLGEASRLRQAGRIDEAIAAYTRVLALKPDLPDSWYNLGWLQRHTRRFQDALQSYQRALELNVSVPEEVHVNRAVILADHLFRPDDAEQELNDALRKNPQYVPALLNLGNLMEDVGRREEARSAYERALTIEPDHVLALARLAGVSHSPSLDATLADRLRRAMSQPGRSAAEAADLGFALAGLLEAAQHYDDAFVTVTAANAASQSAGGPSARYDRDVHERFVDRLIETFDTPVEGGSPERSPLFICGMYRSGSTLVEQILAGHRQVTAGGELDLIPLIASRIRDYPEGIRGADAAVIEGWGEAYLQGLPVRPSEDRLVTDKRPDNFLHVGLIKTIFPGAKIVHTRRNPLDNIVSLYFLHLDPRMAYALKLEDAAHWYGQYVRLMAHWKTLYADDIVDVDYDDLVRDPQPAVEHLLKSCGLPWDDGVLEFHRRRMPVKTASVWQVREPLHSRSSGRWRHYEKQLKSLEPLLGI